jgi:glyoxylase-like metal-dependent hydrolase (beta-lactamase superfamily II)
MRLGVHTHAIAVAAAFVGSATLVLFAQQPPAVRALTEPWPEIVKVDGVEILHVRKGIYMFVGGGANVTAQVGDEGVLLVDAGAPGQTDRLIAAIRHLTKKPLRYLVNTSADADHAGGNGAVVKAAGGTSGPAVGGPPAGGAGRPANVGILTIAHENAVNRMIAGSRTLPPLTGDALPESTFFTPRKEFYANGEAVQVLHQPHAHTDGDVLVFFRGSDVVSAGEVFRTDSYPRIDLASGGSIQGELDALNAILDITVPERNQMGGTRVVPARGRISNEADVLEYRDMLTIVRDRVREMVKEGKTLQQVKAAHPMIEYDGIYGKDKDWTGEMFLETVYRDLSQNRKKS